MAIEFRCIRCGNKLRVKDSDAGNRARCPSCEAIVDIPPKDQPSIAVVMTREKSDVIDYELFGQETQHVEITLDPSEVVFGNMNNLMYMSPGIAVEDAAEPKVDDDSTRSVLRSIGWLGRNSRNLQMTAFCNVAEQREVVAFAPNTPSRILPIHMDEYGMRLFCRISAILCLARGIEMTESPIQEMGETLTQLKGDGIAALCLEGSIHNRILYENQQLDVATNRIVAFSSEISLTKYECSGVVNPVSVTSVRGPGELWLAGGYRE